MPFETKACKVCCVHLSERLPISCPDVVATTCFGTEAVAVVFRWNIVGVQFHLLRESHRLGVNLYKSFLIGLLQTFIKPMQFIPSINVKSGKCVMLSVHEFGSCKMCSTSPLEAVSEHGSDRTKWLHVVDLGGASSGCLRNMSAIKRVVQSVDCSVQVGGRVRSFETVCEYLKAGAARVVLGLRC